MYRPVSGWLSRWFGILTLLCLAILGLSAFLSPVVSEYNDACLKSTNTLNRFRFEPLPGFVHVYEHPDFKGECQRFRGEDNGRSYRNDMNEFGRIGNDRISTMILGPGTRVVACASEHHGGPCAEWGPFPTTQRISGLGALNDQISELWVYGSPTRHALP